MEDKAEALEEATDSPEAAADAKDDAGDTEDKDNARCAAGGVAEDAAAEIFFFEIRSNVCSAEKLTKCSTVLLLRLVSFSTEQTLLCRTFQCCF